jgi:hypothetical protein
MAWLWKPSFSGGQQLTAMVIAAHTIAAASKTQAKCLCGCYWRNEIVEIPLQSLRTAW